MSLWPSRRGGPAGGERLLGGGLRFCGPASACCYGVHPTPRALARYGSSWRTSRTWPPRPGPVRPAQRVPRCRASARCDGPHPVPRASRCPARPCATSSWATSECPTSPSSTPAAAARIWLLLADKPHAASAAWLHRVGRPFRPPCPPSRPRCRASACRDGPHPAPAPPATARIHPPRRPRVPPGATPASLPPLPGAPRRGAARRRSSPRLGRSSAPRWWGSP